MILNSVKRHRITIPMLPANLLPSFINSHSLLEPLEGKWFKRVYEWPLSSELLWENKFLLLISESLTSKTCATIYAPGGGTWQSQMPCPSPKPVSTGNADILGTALSNFTAVDTPLLQFWQFLSTLFFSPCQIKSRVKLSWSLICSCYPYVI